MIARRRSPQGERGLKSIVCGNYQTASVGRSPQGERGLKFGWPRSFAMPGRSLPARGAWIEISTIAYAWYVWRVSLPARGAWIEIIALKSYWGRGRSRSPQGERGLKCPTADGYCSRGVVAPRKGSVD